MTDPMDTPPADHGSDRYGYIEIQGPADVALPIWLTADYEPCPDCNANLFLEWKGTQLGWHSTVAHDDGCPAFAQFERGRE